MRKVLIADDEPEIVDCLCDAQFWAELGFEICGTANDGEQVYKFVSENDPDLIILDIGLPKMTGLEVLKKLREEGNNVHIIIVSGYVEFKFAKQAIRLGASDYLIKPCSFSELKKAVLSISDKISGDLERKHLEEMRKRIENDAEYIKQKLLLEIVCGTMPKKDVIEYYFKFHNDPVCACMLACEDETLYGVYSLAKKAINKFFDCEITIDKNRIIIIIKVDVLRQDIMRANMREALLLIHKEVPPGHYVLSMGIGNPANGVENWKKSLAQAELVYDASLIYGDNATFLYNDILPLLDVEWKYPKNQQDIIFTGIEQCDMDKALSGLKGLFIEMRKLPPLRQAVLSISFSLCFAVVKFAKENNLDCELLFGEQTERFSLARNCISTDKLYIFFKDLIKDVFSEYSKRISMSPTVKSAVEFIKERFRENIGLVEVANHVYISPSRLSTVFKKEMGLGLKEFIRKTRIKNACNLLKNPESKISEIAWLSGFDEEKYFYSAFKKEMKLTPSAYRQKHT